MSGSKISITELPISLRFRIAKEKLLTESQKEEWGIESEEIDIQEFPGVSYRIGISSKIFKDHKTISGNCLIIHVRFKNEEKLNFNVDYKISIPTANYTDHYRQLKNEVLHLCWNHLGQAEELFDPTKNFIVNDYLIISMEAILSVQKEEIGDTVSDAKESKCCKLGLELWERDYKDFTFIVEEKEIKVHKCVIAAKSPVFDRMIQSGLKETKESKVLITDFDFDVVETGIKFCYGIEEKHLWNVEIATKLLLFSDKYDISDLKTSAETFLSSQISRLNVCRIANASILGNSVKLRQQCFEYLFECNQNKTFVRDLKLLDKDFAVELLEASFSRSAM